jgi:FKBP-type peptidyl-prolyl cis-trans isomerase FkpA
MTIRAAAAITVVLITACQGGPAGSGQVALDTEDQKASYAIGTNMGNSLVPAADHIHLDQLIAGVRDALEDRDLRLDQAEMQTVMAAFNETVQAELAEQREADAESNRAAGEAFLAENADKDGVVTTESGLQYEVLREGEGPTPTASDRVTINYRGTLVDGTEFDTSYGREPSTFAVGGVIPGFSEALQLMAVGSHYRVAMPSDLAYGPQGSPPTIGPNATLIFEIELLEIAE